MSEKPAENRREFIKKSTVSVAGAAIAANLASLSSGAYASGTDTLRIGLVGCGGRGSGAAADALSGDPNTELVAVADAFMDHAEASVGRLEKLGGIGDRVKVKKENMFAGLDAYKHVIDSVDVVLLCTPPGFRPEHLKYAVEAGRHIFTEKPMATDAPGLRSCLESVAVSKTKPFAMLAGFCWRYDYEKKALFDRCLAGEIGDIRAAYGTYLTSPVKPMPAASTRPKGMPDLEWMVRNWYNFAGLSGDGLVEQACHTVDWIAWAMGDKPPVSCTATGGRQLAAEGGDIYDHVSINYVWDNDARGFLAQRQIPGCFNENMFTMLGTKGTGKVSRRGSEIQDLSGETTWKYEGPRKSMYRIEHEEFFASIRSGKHIHNGDRMCNSTLMALMGRLAGYTGKEITWEQALNSQEKLVPEITDGWNSPVTFRDVPLPGVTKYV